MTAEQKQGAKNFGLLASTLGVGSAIGLALASVLRNRPELIVDLVKAFGPMFMVVISLMYLVDRHAAGFVEVQRGAAIAQQRLADAVQAIAQKDDRQAERLAREISFVGGQVEKLLAGMDEIRLGRREEKARGASA